MSGFAKVKGLVPLLVLETVPPCQGSENTMVQMGHPQIFYPKTIQELSLEIHPQHPCSPGLSNGQEACIVAT